ncbi:MAG: mandelate racemase [Chloroflexales bacterium]|nr:mandelate racemase [Chloroflexales bacterium]
MITRTTSHDRRYDLAPGEGADAVHTNPQYAYAVCLVHDDSGIQGTGLAFTLGGGNMLVCQAIDILATTLVGRDIEELMAEWGTVYQQLANHHQLRWLGPHKGVVHLALAAITNGCFDLWAKKRGVPLWRLLLDLSPDQIVALLDLRYLEDVLSPAQAIALINATQASRPERMGVIASGYPGYDTSVGWFHYDEQQVRENAKRALAAGFGAIKLKVGARDPNYDLRRAAAVRDAVGDATTVMLDANQQWTLPQALEMCQALQHINPLWVEEPTHPDDVLAHQTIARAIAPVKVAAGEHVPNAVVFKNYLQLGAMHYVQADCVRVGGISEFITISLLARHYNLPVAPHVGDMGQIHQHLVLFNHIALGHQKLFLEYIPHLRQHFVHPAIVRDGVYHTPMEPGSSSDLAAGGM